MRKLTTEEFIDRAREVHGDRFDYEGTNYLGANYPITIRCKTHGIFTTTMESHLKGAGGCKECNKDKFRNQYTFSREDVLNIIHDKYGNLYDTSKVEYSIDNKNITLGCSHHGDFTLRLDKVQVGQICPKCSRNQSYSTGYDVLPLGAKLIPLNHGLFTIVDEEDYEMLDKYIWHSNKKGYITNGELGKMHRMLLGNPKGLLVDHKNRCVYDNRKSNLRITDVSGNGANKEYSKGKSNLKGVTFHSCGKWRARVSFKGRRISLGLFDTEEEAGVAYDLGAIKYQGEYCVLNYPHKLDEYLKQLGITDFN